jgi:hypothetical protein
MFAQPSGEADIFPVFQVALSGDQCIQLYFQGLGLLSENGPLQARFLGFQLESRLQNRSQLLGKPYRPAGFAFFHLFQVFQQVREAFLFEPVLQPLSS